jgi:hypothetical protein
MLDASAPIDGPDHVRPSGLESAICLSGVRLTGAPISGPTGTGNYRDGAPVAERLPPTRAFYQSTIGTVFRLANCQGVPFPFCQIGTEQASY